MDIVFNLYGQTYYIDTAVVTPFSANLGLMTAASARPGHMAKREEKKNSIGIPASTWSHSSLRLQDDMVSMLKIHQIPVRRHGPPPTAIRDAWAAIQTTLHGGISKTTTPGGHHVTVLPSVSPPLHPTTQPTRPLTSHHMTLGSCPSLSYTRLSADL